MQATETAYNRDFARKAATAARWTGKALWFVLGSIIRVLYVLITAFSAFSSAFSGEKSNSNDEAEGLGPVLSQYGHQDRNHALQDYWDESK